jgi:hypothetical protein
MQTRVPNATLAVTIVTARECNLELLTWLA